MINRTTPLEGIRVIDFSHVFQGPMCTQLLADFGADVIKVERPDSGDWSRKWGPFIGDVSLPFVGLNRNKRSLALNLRNETAKKIILKLIKTADVLVHNFRPGAMERLGLGYDDLKVVNPKLIYAYSSGWGDRGPYVERGRGGHDLMARATGGMFAPIGPEGLPVPAGISADYPAGLLLGLAILLALVAREKTGHGQLVSTDLLSATFHSNTWGGPAELNKSKINSEGDVGGTEKAIRSSFKTKDGYIELSPVFSPNALRDISVAMGLGDLSQDPRFNTSQNQIAHGEALNNILAKRFLEKTTGEWISTLEARGVLCAEIKTYEQAGEDPQVLANDMVVKTEHPTAGTLRLLGTPIRLYDTPRTLRYPPPNLGEHNTEILMEIGYTKEEIAAFEREGVFG